MTKLTALAEILHQEHVTTIIALGVLEERGLGRDKNKPVDAEVAEGRAKLQAVLDVIDREIIQHFRFEEEQLFPVLANRGYDDLAKSLEQEHDAIQALAPLRLVDPLAPTRARLRAPHRCFRNHDLHRHEQSHAQAHPTLTPFPDGL